MFDPNQAAGVDFLQFLVGRVINISVAGAFVALVVVLVWAGIRFLTSGGDQKALSQASATMTWGLLGMLFLAIAWLVLQLIAAFTGIEALKSFDITILQK